MNEQSRNEKAAHFLLVGVAYLVYCAAVVYGDLMFLQVVGNMFSSDPVLHALSFGGAIMTAVSAMLLPIAKIRWLMPGPQMLAGWLFWFIEVGLLMANAALAYSLANTTDNELMALWRPFSPATPMIAVLGWGILFMLDPRNKMRHAMFEGFADQVDQYSERMRVLTKSPEVKRIVDERALYWAKVLADETIPKMMGIPDDVIRRVRKQEPAELAPDTEPRTNENARSDDTPPLPVSHPDNLVKLGTNLFSGNGHGKGGDAPKA